ncbi:MAG: LysR family transcriptional regulator [Pseudomonadota bacterium]
MSTSLDRLTLLETFTRIAERGSISAAARDLGLSQASASRQLAQLEAQLGVVLIQRTTHRSALTEAGKDCLAEALSLLEGWETLAERYAGEDTQMRGKLKIVAPIALGQLHLAVAALGFQKTHPGISITWLLDDAPIRFAEIGCDLWIKIGRVPDESLVVRPLGKVERMIVAAPDLLDGRQTLTPSDLASVPCVALEPFEAGTIPLENDSGRTVTISASVAITTNNMLAARTAAKLGVGYAVMPRWFVEASLRKGALIDLLPDWRASALAINAAFQPSRRQTRKLRAFIDHIATQIARVPGIEVEHAG